LFRAGFGGVVQLRQRNIDGSRSDDRIPLVVEIERAGCHGVASCVTHAFSGVNRNLHHAILLVSHTVDDIILVIVRYDGKKWCPWGGRLGRGPKDE
jgi:hypothetical protein